MYLINSEKEIVCLTYIFGLWKARIFYQITWWIDSFYYKL